MKTVKRQEIFKWLKDNLGKVTIQDMVSEFKDSADPKEIAYGFNMYCDWIEDGGARR